MHKEGGANSIQDGRTQETGEGLCVYRLLNLFPNSPGRFYNTFQNEAVVTMNRTVEDARWLAELCAAMDLKSPTSQELAENNIEFVNHLLFLTF